MRRSVQKTALVDSGFWIALLDGRDEHHQSAQSKAETLLRLQYVVPWPTLYETLRTRFVRRPLLVGQFERFLKRPNATLLDDAKYKEDALELALAAAAGGRRQHSLVDHVLRLVIDDANVKLDCIFTFNVADFRDLCLRRRMEIV